jgi:thiol-disulfide isomerase/thioredoxin
MKRFELVTARVLLAGFGTLVLAQGNESHGPKVVSTPQWETIKSLVGELDGYAEQGGKRMPTHITIPVPGDGSAVMRWIDAGTVPTREFPQGLDWLNTAAPLTLKKLRGKVVLLDFWTYGCINCMHDFPWIRKLEEDFPDTLVVIGVHSAKFAEEGNTRNIREIILRYGIDYPVINDSRFTVWHQWGVSAWPTLALVDPAGNVVTERAGEGFYPEFKAIITSLVNEFGAKGLLDLRPLKLKLEKEGLPQTVLSFPGKVRVDPKGNRLFISDTDHDRIVVAALDTGQVLEVIGCGKKGFMDGDFATARFDHPQGTVLSQDGGTLYVADTGNNSLRRVNLLDHRVTTLDGTGAQATEYPPPGGTAPGVALSSPWDLALAGNDLYVAMAGCHQIWRMDLTTGRIGAYAGTGAEGAQHRSGRPDLLRRCGGEHDPHDRPGDPTGGDGCRGR